VQQATEDQVWLALAVPSPWPVALSTDDTWRPLADLALPAVRDDVCDRIAGRLGGCLPRVAWSTLVLGLAARLWGATLPSVTREGVLIDVDQLAFTDDDGALRLGLRRPTGSQGATAEDVHRQVTGALSPIIASIPLSPRLLWGNAASALDAAPRVLELPQARPLVAAILAKPPYEGEMEAGRRRTCCLFYLVPGGGLCSDCVLDAVPTASGPSRPA
jgi:iron complex transport system ATP-binding protein